MNAARKPRSEASARRPGQQEKEQSRRDRGAFLDEDRGPVQEEGQRESPPAPLLGKPERGQQAAEDERGGERLAAPDDARHRLDVNRMDGEKKRGPDCGGRRDVQAQKQPREQQRRRRVEQNVDDMEGDRVSAVDPPLRGEGEKQRRAVRRAGSLRAAEILRGEDLGDALRGAQAEVVPDDRLVVVRERARQPVGVDEDARAEQQERPREPEALASHRIW